MGGLNISQGVPYVWKQEQSRSTRRTEKEEREAVSILLLERKDSAEGGRGSKGKKRAKLLGLTISANKEQVRAMDLLLLKGD